MTIAAHELRHEPAGEHQSRELLGSLLSPAALGVLFGAALAVGLTTWFSAQARQDLAEDAWNRDLIMELSAVADVVGAIEDAEVGEAVTALAEALEPAEREGDTHLKVVALNGARLLTSTDPADHGESATPRRLKRDEKWLFDSAQGIRAAAETNAREGVFRLRQIEIEPLGERRVRVTLPWSADGEIAGVVVAERERTIRASRPSLAWAGVATVVAWLAMAAIVALFQRRSGSADPAGRNWRYFVAGALVIAVLAGGLAAAEVRSARALQGQLIDGLATRLATLEEQVASVAGRFDVSVSPGEENRWDTDLYQRPLGVITAGGTVSEAGLAARGASLAGALERAIVRNVAAGVAVVAFFALGFATRIRRNLAEHRYAYLYVMPAMIGMLVLVFFPFTYGVALSFTDQTLLNVSEPLTSVFNGVANYVSILGDLDVVRSTAEGAVINYRNFYWTLLVTICWTVSNVAVGFTLGMILALMLNTKGLKFTNTYRVLLILPWAMPNYITALIWKGMFHQQFGVINQAIQIFGGSPVSWFDGVLSAFMTGLITNGWLSFPFMMVVILGGLQSITQEMYEAATIDGAGRWQQFWQITLPSLKPTIIPAVIISAVWTFNMFNVIYLVSAGEPAGANEILITRAYKIAFEEYRYGYAAAYSVVIFLVLLAYGVIQARATRATEATTA